MSSRRRQRAKGRAEQASLRAAVAPVRRVGGLHPHTWLCGDRDSSPTHKVRSPKCSRIRFCSLTTMSSETKPAPSFWRCNARFRNCLDLRIKTTIHANPDMGSWKNEQSMERGLRLTYPLALTVSHAKWNSDRFGLATPIALSKEMGFNIQSKVAALNPTRGC